MLLWVADLVLASSLLTGQGVPLSEAVLRDQFPVLRYPLIGLALEYEILDPRETRYVLARQDDIRSDLQMLRRRWQELADAPPLCDSFRFPDRNTVNELLVFNRAYRHYLEVRLPVENAYPDEVTQAIKEVDHLYQVWDAVRDARCDYYYVTVRRQALKHLRELVGDDAYFRAELPPHIPLWRFQEIP